MTKTIVKTALELRNELEHNIAVLNEKIVLNASNDEITDAVNAANEVCEDLNEALKLEKYAALRASENPMRDAILALTFPKVTVKRKEDRKTKAVSYVVIDGFKYIDLAAFEDFCGKGIGNAPGWRYKSMDLARFLAARKTKELGGDWKDTAEHFKMDKRVEKTQIADPTSNTQLTKRLQEMVDAIIYVANDKDLNLYKCKSEDIAFIMSTLFKQGKKTLSVAAPQWNTIVNRVMQVINHLMTGNPYELIFKRDDE